jgi:hypothetical protein
MKLFSSGSLKEGEKASMVDRIRTRTYEPPGHLQKDRPFMKTGRKEVIAYIP